MLKLAEKFKGSFKVSFSITGTAIEQLRRFNPEVLDYLKKLYQTGCVEFLAETYYHSLAFLFSHDEFIEQIGKHQKTVKELFGAVPVTFRNTELIFNNAIASAAGEMGFKNILAEGADHILKWRSPNYLYQTLSNTAGTGINLLLKNYRLSDDIAFRFSDKSWPQYPLTADRYCSWIKAALEGREIVNLFMDYETLGEHQWKESGIFSFMEKFITAIINKTDIDFITPLEAASRHKSAGIIDVPEYTSWADMERNLSAWTGNSMQKSALGMVSKLEKEIRSTGDEGLLDTWRKLQSSDHFYYMSTKYFSDGDVHKYFNYFPTPYDAFIVYSNIVNDLHETLKSRAADLPAGIQIEKTAETLNLQDQIKGQYPRPVLI
jgi:alpha-amylase